MAKAKQKPTSFWRRHKHLTHALIVMLVILTLIGLITAFGRARTIWRQARLDPFYNTADLPVDGPLGEVVRQEPLNVNVEGATAKRVLYRTQKSDGTNTFSSGMIFIPNTPTPTEGRPVVAWAHGTLGMGKQCAPTRTPNPVDSLSWVSSMLEQGWVVTATDYAGLGTPGTQEYLVGNSEAYDVLNSVRAAQNLPEANANNQFAIWGHSQGGHAALFTGSLAATYAPELQLVATAAIAPAAELGPLLAEQANTAADWVIGPEVVISWPAVNPQLNGEAVLTSAGKNNYKRIANMCIEDAAIAGLVRTSLKQEFFSVDLLHEPAWAAEIHKQTAPTLDPSQPLLVVESTTDNVVLPNTTALYIQNACNASSNLTALWVSDVTHMQLAKVTAPDVITWLVDRFAGQPTSPTCGNAAPIAPATNPT